MFVCVCDGFKSFFAGNLAHNIHQCHLRDGDQAAQDSRSEIPRLPTKEEESRCISPFAVYLRYLLSLDSWILSSTCTDRTGASKFLMILANSGAILSNLAHSAH